jgi:hypothetical protein
MRKISVMIAILLALAGFSRPAQADYAVELIRVVCVPEISLFELETFDLEDISTSFRHSQGVYTLREFVAKPPSCQLKVGKIDIEVASFSGSKNDDVSICSQVEWASLNIRLNGETVDQIKQTHGGCGMMPSPRHQIRATAFDLTHCETDFDEPDQTIPGRESRKLGTTCKTISLRD